MATMNINQRELSALNGLPYLQQLLYLRGIRPYVDSQTGIVGIKRGISYQSLAEALYIEPHSGIKSGSPSKDQIRRALKHLECINLISLQSQDWKLIIYCPLVITMDFSAQNKLATKPPHNTATNPQDLSPLSTRDSKLLNQKATTGKPSEAAIPLKSKNNNLCVYAQFESFWALYPQKRDKQKAWDAFQALAPSTELFACILTALQNQLDSTVSLQNQGLWTPKWKFPANWLIQQCWNDEIDMSALEENQHASHSEHSKKQPVDPFWESCKPRAVGTNKAETDAKLH